MTKKRGRIIATGIVLGLCIVFPPLICMGAMLGVIACGLGLIMTFMVFFTTLFEGLWRGEIDPNCKEAGQGMLISALGISVFALMMWATSPLIDMWANWLERLA